MSFQLLLFQVSPPSLLVGVSKRLGGGSAAGQGQPTTALKLPWPWLTKSFRCPELIQICSLSPGLMENRYKCHHQGTEEELVLLLILNEEVFE